MLSVAQRLGADMPPNLLARQWSVADVLPLCKVLGRAEKFCVSWDIFVNSFEELLL